MNKGRVLVGMSGGVDSSVAAALLVEQGYEAIGITIKTHGWEQMGVTPANDKSCCSLEGINDARVVCAQLGMPHYVLDFSEAFKLHVIDLFTSEYLAGNTPNPCVVCNREIKWGRLLQKADDLGADYIAMGHYARIGNGGGRWYVSRGADRTKDQSYALWALTQASLARTLLPLGDMTKAEVRAWAASRGIRTAQKQESFEICFVPDNDYAAFLKRGDPDLERRVKGGPVMFEGRVIGAHEGYPFYTIGQRRGLNVAVGEPVYVTRIDPATNTVTVGREEELCHGACVLRSVNHQKWELPDTLRRTVAKIRYKDEGAPATLLPQENNGLLLRFDDARRAVTPGQSAVWYDGDDVAGGGVIDAVLE